MDTLGGAEELRVVVNDEDQYSIVPVWQETPPGWRAVGVSGSRATVRAFIEEAWTDMRPRSAREGPDATASLPAGADGADPIIQGPTLLDRLLDNTHRVEVECDVLAEARAGGLAPPQFLLLGFPQTPGATQLRVQLDLARSELRDQEATEGIFHIEGQLVLDGAELRLTGDVSLGGTSPAVGCVTITAASNS